MWAVWGGVGRTAAAQRGQDGGGAHPVSGVSTSASPFSLIRASRAAKYALSETAASCGFCWWYWQIPVQYNANASWPRRDAAPRRPSSSGVS